MINRFASLFYRDETLQKLNKKIKMLGVNSKYNAVTFMNIRVFSSILVFILAIISFKYGYIIAPIITYLYYRFLPNIYFDSKIKKRSKKLDRDALYFFEILSLSLESGNNLTAAITSSCKSIDSDLAFEFREVIREVSFGKSLDEALDSMKERIPSDTVNNIILNIRESNIFGNNIIDTLYNQIDYIREKIVLENRAYISKMPIKISIISVMFFIPLLLLIILGPVVIKYIIH
ncbi:MAG: type II secretion system F family protein [Bacilli bacterium]|nr:type II secretion system F family protein [Bacilli bacterium]